MFLRKSGDNNWYVCRTSHGQLGKRNKNGYRNWFLIKYGSSNKGNLNVGHITFQKELVGKRIRLKVEVIDDGANGSV